jgi:hypothetical protein
VCALLLLQPSKSRRRLARGDDVDASRGLDLRKKEE